MSLLAKAKKSPGRVSRLRRDGLMFSFDQLKGIKLGRGLENVMGIVTHCGVGLLLYSIWRKCFSVSRKHRQEIQNNVESGRGIP